MRQDITGEKLLTTTEIAAFVAKLKNVIKNKSQQNLNSQQIYNYDETCYA